MFHKINITKWLKNEIHRTELELLRAEDELANAQLRVKALQSRVTRLKGKAAKRPPVEDDARANSIAAQIMGVFRG